ncbi:peptidylprolyl isomerase [Chamaesiphon sp. OTE_8_metabat_110]|uniref:foldase protein PrsA n=1 Tax=Chamaesiphon sp. OTE_8_metabat_110 TaxID=2964696 RepID=UPI00286CC4CA|nr:peptidylprolyl isomerase [Chamaesiphon sp. OTE_8_metabat_110]
MSAVLQIGDTSLTAEQLLPLISKYRLVPQLAKEMIIEAAIKDYEITETEHQDARQRFCQQQQLGNEQDLDAWLQQQQLGRDDLKELIDRELQLRKFKIDKWETQVESHFCQRKSQIDRVVFSMIRVKEIDVAEEIYFRLVSEEASFVELAPHYSEGIEAKTKGISGPVELGKLDPILANALITLQPLEVLPPLQIGEWWVVLQLETIIPAQLDEEMRQYLTEELFNQWIYEEVQKLLSTPPISQQSTLAFADKN